MSTTTTGTMPVTKDQVEAELAEVRSELHELERRQYESPDDYRGTDPRVVAYWDRRKVLRDRESVLEVRLGVLTRQEKAAEQAAPAPAVQTSTPTITLPVGVDPEAVSDELRRRYEDAVLQVEQGKPGSKGRLAQCEAKLVDATTEHRRQAALAVARERQAAEEAEAERQLAAGRAEKERLAAQSRLEDLRRKLHLASIEWAKAATEFCEAGVAARNEALHSGAVSELRAALTAVPPVWSKRLLSELGGHHLAPKPRRIV